MTRSKPHPVTLHQLHPEADPAPAKKRRKPLTEARVASAVGGVLAKGCTVARVDVHADGTITVHTTAVDSPSESSDSEGPIKWT